MKVNSIKDKAFKLLADDLKAIKTTLDTAGQVSTLTSISNNWLATADWLKEVIPSWIHCNDTKEVS